MNRFYNTVLFVCLICFIPTTSLAGKIGDIKDSAKEKSSSSHDDDDDDDDGSWLFRFFFGFNNNDDEYQTDSSESYDNNSTGANRDGEWRLSADRFRFEMDYMESGDADDDIQGVRAGLELAAEDSIGIMGDIIFFDEDNPDDNLEHYSVHIFGRLASKHFEVNPGIGFHGLINIDDGISFTMPVRVYLNENLGLEFHPTAGHLPDSDEWVYEMETSVFVGFDRFKLKAGYRHWEFNNIPISGWFGGFSISF